MGEEAPKDMPYNPAPENRRVDIAPLEDENPEVRGRKIVEFLDEHHADDGERQAILAFLEKNPHAALYLTPDKLVLRTRRSSASFEEAN